MLATLVLAAFGLFAGDGRIRSRCLTSTITTRDTCPYYIVDGGFVSGPFTFSACDANGTPGTNRFAQTIGQQQRFTFDTGILFGVSIWNTNTSGGVGGAGPTLGGESPAGNLFRLQGGENITPASGISGLFYPWGRPLLHLTIASPGTEAACL